MEISGEENVHSDEIYQSVDLLVKRLVAWSATKEVLKKLRIMQKCLRLAYSGGRYNITLESRHYPSKFFSGDQVATK